MCSRAEPTQSSSRLEATSTIGARIKYWLEILAALATIIAIAVAAQQYIKSVADGRVSATLSYVARFNSDPALKSLINLYSAWNTKTNEEEKSGDPTSDQIKFINDNHLRWDVVLLGDFFDQLYVCMRRDICDESLAITMLGRDIETVYVLSGRYLSMNMQPTGCGLRALFEVAHPRLNFSRLEPQEKQGKAPPHPKLRSDACPNF